MDIEKTYSDIIEKLKNNIRPQLDLTKENLELLAKEWRSVLDGHKPKEYLEKILCILDNANLKSGMRLPIFEELIIDSLSKLKDSKTVVFVLGISQKLLIPKLIVEGRTLPLEYIKGLKNLLYSKHPEVVEWSVRTIETLGRDTLKFKDDLTKIRPSVLSGLLNINKKNIRTLVDSIFNKKTRGE